MWRTVTPGSAGALRACWSELSIVPCLSFCPFPEMKKADTPDHVLHGCPLQTDLTCLLTCLLLQCLIYY